MLLGSIGELGLLIGCYDDELDGYLIIKRQTDRAVSGVSFSVFIGPSFDGYPISEGPITAEHETTNQAPLIGHLTS